MALAWSPRTHKAIHCAQNDLTGLNRLDDLVTVGTVLVVRVSRVVNRNNPRSNWNSAGVSLSRGTHSCLHASPLTCVTFPGRSTVVSLRAKADALVYHRTAPGGF